MRSRRGILVFGTLAIMLGLLLAVQRSYRPSSLIVNAVDLPAQKGCGAVASPPAAWIPGMQMQRLAVAPHSNHFFVLPLPNGYVSPAQAGSGIPLLTFNAASGAMVHCAALPGIPLALVPDGPAQRVLVLLQGIAALGVVDAQTGQALRSIRLAYPLTALAVDSRTGLAYAVGVTKALQPSLSVIDVRAGRVARSVPLDSGWPEWVLVDAHAGRIFVGSEVSGMNRFRVAMLTTGTMRLLRVLEAPGGTTVAALDARRGRLYVARGTDVLVIDSRRDALLRTIATIPTGSPWRVGALSLTAGVAPWQLPKLVVDTQSGHVALVLPLLNQSPPTSRTVLLNDRRVLRVIPVQVTPFAMVLSMDDRRGHLLVSDGRHLMIVDMRTGAILRSIMLTAADDVAVDGTTNHAVALSMEPRQVTPADPWRWLPDALRRIVPIIPRSRPPYVMPGRVTIIDLAG